MRVPVTIGLLLALPLSLAADIPPKPAYTSDIITLREYVDVRFDAQQKAVEAALASADRAVVKAETASDKRFDSVNEFRKSLSDETATFLPRAEYLQSSKATDEKVQELTSRIAALENRSVTLSQVGGYLVGFFGFIAALISVFLQFRKSPGIHP
jgi:phage I-like protein